MDTTTITNEIAARVTAAMEQSGTSRAGLSEATGIPRTTLNRSLGSAGNEPTREFTIPELIRVSRHLGKTLSDFVSLPELEAG